MASNFDKLHDAGFVLTTSVPQAHKDVLDGLSDDEVAVILEVQDRLTQADQDEGLSAQTGFTTFFTF